MKAQRIRQLRRNVMFLANCADALAGFFFAALVLGVLSLAFYGGYKSGRKEILWQMPLECRQGLEIFERASQ